MTPACSRYLSLERRPGSGSRLRSPTRVELVRPHRSMPSCRRLGVSASREDGDERYAAQDLRFDAAQSRRSRLVLAMNAVNISREGAVSTITLDRPKARNAVDRATAKDLADAFRAFEADEAAAVAVLWGNGGTFCAGADLRAFGAGAGNRVEPDGDGPMGPTRLALSKPVIAAVSGYAVAGGLELALWCDLRIVEEDAIFGVFCRRWGVPLIDGGTVRLPRLIGLGRALDMILTGRPVGAKRRWRSALPVASCPRGQRSLARKRSPPKSPAFPLTRCAVIVDRPMNNRVLILRRLLPGSSASASKVSVKPGRAPIGLSAAAGAAAASTISNA